MMKNNREIRKAAHDSGVSLAEVADYLGVSPKTVYSWLRLELTGNRKQKMLDSIEAAKVAKYGE